MRTNKSEIIAARNEKTGQSYKHEALWVGDVYQNPLGTRGIVTFRLNEDGTKKYLFCKANGAEHGLPEDRAGFNSGDRVGNVCDDEALMQEFIENGLIIDDGNVAEAEVVAEIEPTKVEKVEEKAEEKPKTTRKRSTKKEPETATCDCCCDKPVSLLTKINNIRAAWSNTDVEKEGLGRAGGNSKYHYYKPQQVIDFCLKEEIKQGIFSEFNTQKDELGLSCCYKVTDIDTGECKVVACPFDVPRKMACSEAQQVGAALTYYNRRLAMLMYKIEDNSKESVEVLDDADYTAQTVPEIPAPPIIVPPVIETQAVAAPQTDVQIEPPISPVIESNIQKDINVPPVQKDEKSVSVPWETDHVEAAPKVEIPQAVPQGLPPAPPVVEHVVPQTPLPPAPAAPKKKSIEDLY